jgi:hypothetical protein
MRDGWLGAGFGHCRRVDTALGASAIQTNIA